MTRRVGLGQVFCDVPGSGRRSRTARLVVVVLRRPAHSYVEDVSD